MSKRSELARLRRAAEAGDLTAANELGDMLEDDGDLAGAEHWHRLGPSTCTVTRTRLLIDDARGGMSQILLRDITGISMPGRIISPKQLRISVPGAAYDIYCTSKDQKNQLEAWLYKAIRST